jgi:flagellar biogenesis protein FliO
MHSMNKNQGVLKMFTKTHHNSKKVRRVIAQGMMLVAGYSSLANAQSGYAPNESGSTRQSIIYQLLQEESKANQSSSVRSDRNADSGRYGTPTSNSQSMGTNAARTAPPTKLPKMRTPTIPSHPKSTAATRSKHPGSSPTSLAYETRIAQQDVNRHAPPSYDTAPPVATANYSTHRGSEATKASQPASRSAVELASASVPTRAAPSAQSNDFDDSFSLDSKLQEIRRIQEKEGFAVANQQVPSRGTLGSSSGDRQASSGGSFIDREKQAQSSDSSNSASTQETIVKIVVNLAFVLAMGIGFIVLVRMWNMARKTSSLGTERDKKQLKVREVLSLGGGVCLHVVDGPRNQFLVAVDSSGIKSVNIMNASFEDSMEMLESGELAEQFDDEPEAAPTMEQLLGQLASREYQLQESKLSHDVEPEPSRGPSISSSRARVRTGSRRSNNPPEEIEQSKELDEKLISMLLKKGKKAA